jgi:putative ABC transport system permease protein
MQTIRYACLSLARSPAFALIAIVALGLGLGLSTAMFGVLDAVVNPYLPYRDPDSLYWVEWWSHYRLPITSAELYRHIRDETHAFEAVVPFASEQTTIQYDGEPQSITALHVTHRYFAAMGVAPRLGRPFVASDGEDVVLLSQGLWKRMFGTRRLLNGVIVTIGAQPMTVVGVMPEGAGSDVWLPLSEAVEGVGLTLPSVRPFTRLRKGVARDQAAAELTALARSLTIRFGMRDAPFSFELRPLIFRKEEVKGIHKAMIGSALAVLLIACANLAHLMLARGLAKRRELALRLALGASRLMVVRLMFAEAAIITLGGAALGALLAVWGSSILPGVMPREVAWIGVVRPQLSWRVFSIAALAAVMSAVLFGLIPAVRVALNLNLDEPMKDNSGTTTARVRHRHNPFVIAEVALTLALLMGGSLLLRTVHVLQRERPNYNPETLWNVSVRVRRPIDSVAATARLRQQVITTLRSISGVRDAAMVSGRAPVGQAVSAEMTGDSSRTVTMPLYPAVSSSYLQVLGMQVLRGRDFEIGDERGTGVAIVDALAAQRLYPHEDAVGRLLKLGAPSSNARFVPIVGVVHADAPQEGDERYAPQPTVFVSLGDRDPLGDILVRTRVPDPAIGVRLRRALAQNSEIIGARATPFDFARQASLASRGFLARVFIAMGAVALGLASLGLYGVLQYGVSRRRREFSVRIALGADPRRLSRTVLTEAVVMLLAGIGVGAFVALAASRTLDSMLIDVLPSDVASLAASEIILIVAGLAAAAVPAWQASRANPMDILRAN